MNTRSDQAKQFTGKHMLLFMIAFFGVIVAVNLTLAVFASQSWTGLVVKNSYVASQGFNDDLERAKAQAKRGWSGEISYTSGAIQLKLVDRRAAPVVLEQVVARVGRPAFEQSDHRVVMTSTGDGVYRAKDVLEPGIWQVSVRGRSAEGDYRLDARLVVKAATP